VAARARRAATCLGKAENGKKTAPVRYVLGKVQLYRIARLVWYVQHWRTGPRGYHGSALNGVIWTLVLGHWHQIPYGRLRRWSDGACLTAIHVASRCLEYDATSALPITTWHVHYQWA
jgi:hypothetical protein